MRIIAGANRGRVLVAPKGVDTRPTLDRVRESLFNILAPRMQGARVLDLFAGTGALSLEALSRGAASAVLVDHDRRAWEAIERNIAALGCRETATLLKCDWRAAVRKLAPENAQFDICFLDPPYRFAAAEDMLSALCESGVLDWDALVVYEHGRGFVPASPALRATDLRRYGDTEITFLKRVSEGFQA